jgi:hypothetical protein
MNTVFPFSPAAGNAKTTVDPPIRPVDAIAVDTALEYASSADLVLPGFVSISG